MVCFQDSPKLLNGYADLLPVTSSGGEYPDFGEIHSKV